MIRLYVAGIPIEDSMLTADERRAAKHVRRWRTVHQTPRIRIARRRREVHVCIRQSRGSRTMYGIPPLLTLLERASYRFVMTLTMRHP